MRGGSFAPAALAALLLVSSAVLVSLTDVHAAPSPPPTTLAAHAPILIDGNAAFNATNGVVGGAGTANKPYLIRDWAIDADAAAMGIDIRNTTAYFEIANVSVTSFSGLHDAVHLTNVSGGSLVRDTLETCHAGIVLRNVTSVSVSGGTIYQNGADGVDIFGGNAVNVSGVNIISNAGSGVTADGTVNLDLWSNFVSSNFGLGAKLTHVRSLRLGLNGISSLQLTSLVLSNATSVAVAGNGFQGFGASVLAFDNVTWANVTGNTVDPFAQAPFRIGSGLHINVSGNLVAASPGPGLDLWRSRDVAVVDNTLGSQQDGLRILASDGVLVLNNNLTTAHGVFVGASRNGTFAGNLLTQAGFLVQGTSLEDFRSHTFAASNTVGGRPVRAARDCSGTTFDGVAAGQVIVANCTGVRLSHLALNGTRVGILAAYAADVGIANTTVANATLDAILLNAVQGAAIVNSSLQDSGYGLWATGSNISLSNDLLSANSVGASFQGVHGGSIAGSVFTGSGEGLELKATRGMVVHANRFAGNGLTAWDDSVTANAWDAGYPAGGNEWWDYRGWDDCHGPLQENCTSGDGLGDVPYAVPGAGAADRYPLVPVNPPKIPPGVFFRVASNVSWAGVPVIFWDIAVDPLGWPMAAFAWSFGDGSTSTDSNATVSHTYASPGTYTVTLTVTTRRGLSNSTSLVVVVTPIPTLALVPYDSPRGYVMPVPAAWTRTYNVTSNGQSFELLLQGTMVGGTANMIVDTKALAGVQETRAFLGAAVVQTLQALQQEYPDAYLNGTPYIVPLAGHLAATFEIAYGSHPLVQFILVVVSEAHQREWEAVLTGPSSSVWILNATFAQIVSGFNITLAPPTSGPGSGALAGFPFLLALLVTVVTVAVVVLVAVVVSRSRAPRAPRPALIPCPSCGGSLEPGARFCGNCGAPTIGGPPP